MAEILEINFVGFLGDLKTAKGHFEINWPLGSYCWFEWIQPRSYRMYATHVSKHLNSVSLYVRVCQIDVQGVHNCALLASGLKSGLSSGKNRWYEADIIVS